MHDSVFKNCYILFVVLMFPLISSAQKEQTISGEYMYYAPKNVSFEVAERIAIERARIKALAEKYGTSIQSTTATAIKSRGESTDVDISALAFSEVKGEWLKDTRTPEVVFLGYEQNMLLFRARVWGQTRAIATTVDFEVQILRNGTDPKFRSDSFYVGDDLYLYFRTPVAGYLAVYLIDDLDTAYCLLPYSRDPSGVVKVKNNRDYVFFSTQCADEQMAPYVDELYVTSEKAIAYNQIYVVFSPVEFSKANDVQRRSGKFLLPRETSLKEFQQWLAKGRVRDTKMVVKQYTILIKNTE